MTNTKRKINAVISTLALSMLLSTKVFASFDDENDGLYTFMGTGYNTSKTSTYELVAKIDTYLYYNLSDVMYCVADNTYYKRDLQGNILRNDCYGFARARFEKGTSIIGDSGRVYGYGLSTAPSEGCANWSYEPHYYGTAYNIFQTK